MHSSNKVSKGDAPPMFLTFNDIDKQPIHIKDLHHMYTCVIRPNEKAYDRVVKERNNKFVDDWYNTLLSKYADGNGYLSVVLGTDLWEVWNQGKEIKALMDSGVWEHLCLPNEDTVKYWRDVYEKPIEEIASMGKDVAAIGFHILRTARSAWYIREKYDMVFYKSNPLEWLDGYREHNLIFTQKVEPFDLKPMIEKMNVIMNNQYNMDIQPNETLYVEQIKMWSRDFKKEFKDVVDKEYGENVDNNLFQDLWRLWINGHSVRGFANEREHIVNVPRHEIVYWLKIFGKPIDELIEMERPAIVMGHHILATYYNMWFSNQKYENVFKGEVSLKRWHEKYEKNKHLFSKEKGPFDMSTIVEKANSILSNGITVRR